jgi:hypothetical protein
MEIHIGYEAVETGLADASGRPIVKGYRATVCVGVNQEYHRTVYRTPITDEETGESLLSDTPSHAMMALGESMPVVGMRYDPSIHHLLPPEDRPSGILTDKGPMTRYYFPFFDDELAQKKQRNRDAMAEKVGRLTSMVLMGGTMGVMNRMQDNLQTNMRRHRDKG